MGSLDKQMTGQYRYKLVNATGMNLSQIETALNNNPDWEFVQVVVVGSNTIVIMRKRDA